MRRALGASRPAIVRLILSELAVTLGLGISVWASRSWLRSFAAPGGLLFGLSPHDPQTLAASAVLLAAVGIVASAIPAIRATRVDPTVALRTE